MSVIRKKYPIVDENGQSCTFPTFASQVFGDGENPRALWRSDKGFYADDSEKLGGRLPAYYTSPRNLLDNSDFTNPVNQRGQTGYTNSYGIDRWRSWDGHTIIVNNGYVSVAGSMFQYIELSKVKNTDYTLAFCKTDGTIICLTTNPKNGYVWDAGIGMGDDGTSVVVISIDTGDYLWAALYEGEYTVDNLPPYVPKGYGVELAECQRYYCTYGSLRLLLLHNVDGVDRGTFLFPTKMRIIPTLSYEITGDLDAQFTLEETTERGFSCYANGVKGCVQIINCIANADL